MVSYFCILAKAIGNTILNFLSRYSKPRQSTVRTVKDGSLWSLKREVFRAVLSMKYSHESILKALRTVNVLSHLTLSQLHRLSESVMEVSYRKGNMIVNKVTDIHIPYYQNTQEFSSIYQNMHKFSSFLGETSSTRKSTTS